MRRAKRPGTDDAVADKRLFHRKHVVTAFWGIVVGALLFVAGALYQGWQGPQHVRVINPDTTVRIVVTHDSVERESLGQLIAEVRALRRSRSPQIAQRSQQVEDLGELQPNLIQDPPLSLPSVIKGHTQSDLGTFARSSCPARTVRPRADLVAVVSLRTAASLRKLSPIFVRVLRPRSENTVDLLFDQQYEARENNLVLFPAPADTGAYEVEFGFYLTSSLNQEYPPFYRRSCVVRVQLPPST